MTKDPVVRIVLQKLSQETINITKYMSSPDFEYDDPMTPTLSFVTNESGHVALATVACTTELSSGTN
ncbi:hypothetical protein ACF0H5_009408 [Mactra antiquata]